MSVTPLGTTPVKAAGFLTFPGAQGNYVKISRAQLSSMGTLQFTTRVRFGSITPYAAMGVWNNGQAQLIMGDTGLRPLIQVLNTTSGVIGAIQANADIPGLKVGMDVWIRAKVTVSSGQCLYWYSVQNEDEFLKVTWTALGTAVTGVGAGSTPQLAGSVALNLGNFLFGAQFTGRMYFFSEEDDGIETIRFDGNVDLGGVVPGATSFAASLPAGTAAAITTTPKAIGPGYATFPGTSGNYLEIPDAAALDVSTAMYIILRMRQRDTTPNYFSIPVGKGLVYRVVVGPYGLLFSWGPNDTSYFRHLNRTTLDANGQWVWYSIFFDPSGAAGHKVWYSLVDSLTPPAAASWTASFNVAAGASPIGNSTNPLRIGAGWWSSTVTSGPSIDGDIGYVSIRTGSGATPVEGNEVFRLDADNFIGVDPSLTTSLTAGTGQSVAVVRNPAPKDSGYIQFPGTLSNDLVLADASTLEITGPTSFVFKILPRTWPPFTDQTIISKWANAGQRSYAVMMSVSGCLQFLYSIDGSVFYTLTCPEPVPASDSPQVARIDTDIIGGFRIADFYLSPDNGITWKVLGTRQSGLTGTVFNSTSPLVIGAAFDGRLYEMSIFGSEVSTSYEMFRLASEHIPANPHAGTIALPVGTVTVRRNFVPVDFGFIVFPGTQSNFLTVPNEVAFQDNTSFVIEARLIANDWTPPRRNRAIMTKSGSAGLVGWTFLLTSRGTLAFWWSTDGNNYDNFIESPVLDLLPQAAKRVAVSYESGTSGYVRFWTSDNNRDWTRLSETPTSGPMFASIATLIIGNYFDGAISNISFRTSFGPGGVPLQDTEALLIDQTCLAIDPASPTITAVTGQTVTVVRNQSADEEAVDSGYVYFPGTLGNYATTTAAGPPAFPAIAGSMSITMRLAPDRWTGQLVVDSEEPPVSHYEGPIQTICGRWSAGNNHSYLVRLSPAGEFLFTWTNATGATEYTTTSPRIGMPINGSYRYVRLNIDMSVPNQQTLTLYETLDFGDSYKVIGTPVVTTYPTTGLVQGNGPFWIGATEGDTSWFGGRISYLHIYNTAAAQEVFRLDQESLRKPDFTTVFNEANGKTITLHQSLTPTISGYAAFAGSTGEYCRATVPNLSTVTSDFSIMVRINFTAAPLDTEQVIVQKWNTNNPATNLGCSFSLRRKGNSFTFWASADGKTNDISAVVEGMWDDDAVEWGWLAVTTNYSTTGAVVSWWLADDVLTPVGTPLVPVSTDWTLQGEPVTFDDPPVTALYMNTEQVTIGGGEDGKLPLKGWISNVSITNGVGASNAPGGTEKFGWNINSFAGIASDSGAFTAFTGENVVLEPVGATRSMHIEPSPPGPTSDLEPSKPGPTTTIVPAPRGPTTALVRGEAGPSTVLTPAPIGPQLDIYPPSLDRPWWPGTEQDDTSKWWEQPAFTVQRTLVEGQVLGGDYVRGSTSTRTQQTAIRYPTTLPGWTPSGVGKGGLYAQPINYDTIEIEWNIPPQLIVNPTWSEVAIIRASMGYPATVNDGQAIMRMTKAGLYPSGYIYSDLSTIVDYTITGATNATPIVVTTSDPHTFAVDDFVLVRGVVGNTKANGAFFVQAVTANSITLRDSAGNAAYTSGGTVTAYDPMKNTELMTPNQFDPRPPETSAAPGLTPGRWYYYALFFKIGFDWVRSAVHSCLIPRNFHHAEHLWNGLPPYYRYLDDQQRGGTNGGDLKRWLQIYGYEFDMTREYVESSLDMYHTDFTPMPLLRRIGDNFGVPYEPGLGDYSYRALVSKIGFLYRGRGTVGGMRSLINAAAKCDCDVTQSGNVMILPDDSEFMNGTGNWAGIHDLTYPKPTGSGIPASPASYDKIFFTNGTYGFAPGPVTGKGMMHVYTAPADATVDLLITCGDGKKANQAPNPPLEIFPFDVGTPCDPGDVFTFTISCATEFTGPGMQPYLFFFSSGGRPGDFISMAAGLAATPALTGGVSNWAPATVTGTVPANAAWVVPAIAIVGRVTGTNTSRSPYVHFSGASLYRVGSATTVSSDLFVATLSLTGPAGTHPGGPTDTGAELVGPARTSPAFDPFYLGDEE